MSHETDGEKLKVDDVKEAPEIFKNDEEYQREMMELKIKFLQGRVFCGATINN